MVTINIEIDLTEDEYEKTLVMSRQLLEWTWEPEGGGHDG